MNHTIGSSPLRLDGSWPTQSMTKWEVHQFKAPREPLMATTAMRKREEILLDPERRVGDVEHRFFVGRREDW